MYELNGICRPIEYKKCVKKILQVLQNELPRGLLKLSKYWDSTTLQEKCIITYSCSNDTFNYEDYTTSFSFYFMLCNMQYWGKKVLLKCQAKIIPNLNCQTQGSGEREFFTHGHPGQYMVPDHVVSYGSSDPRRQMAFHEAKLEVQSNCV